MSVISSIGLATPQGKLAQTEASSLIGQMIGRSSSEQKLWSRLFKRSGVKQRSSVLLDSSESLLFEREPAPLSARMEIFEQRAQPLALQATEQSLRIGSKAPDQITHLITVTCTGFSAPGLEDELYTKLHLNSDIHRYQLGFMGCHAGLNALQLARALTHSNEGACVLIVMCELCTIHFSHLSSYEAQVSNMLFADGAAAVIVEHTRGSKQLGPSFSKRIPNSSEMLGWRIRDCGFEMSLSAKLPALLKQELRVVVDQALEKVGCSLENIDHYAIHPGGPEILRAVKIALNLRREQVAPSELILEQYGNMSSPTLFFILQSLMNKEEQGKLLMLGFGPGLTVEGQIIDLGG